MSAKTSSSSSSGVGFFGLLTILFIALKLTGYIDWPWIWVLSPMLISITTVVVILLICFGIGVVLEAIKK